MNIKTINDAYKKLKGSVYFDKTLTYLRGKIADYEEGNIDAKLNDFWLNLKNETKWKKTEKQIIDSIRVLTLPKTVDYIENEQDKNNRSIVISNIQTPKTKICKYNTFIDMDLEGFLIGILWVICIGYEIDKNLGDTCYGNRLRNNLIWDEDKITSSPNLFNPYFEQYESWRNNGLDIAQKCVDNKKNVLITMLDLTKYYYSVNITKELFEELTSNDNLDVIYKRINKTVYSIIETYSGICNWRHVFLPIGFHPSNIIANVYLNKIDNSFKNMKDTVYYGRYVDDIMWVITLNNKKISTEISKNGANVISNILIDRLESNKIIKKIENGELILEGEKYLKLQRDKFRFFFLDSNGSKDILLKIKRDIQKNTSEFNYIPEEYASDFNSELLTLKRDDTVNKIRGISDVSLDKYSLSKTIGKGMMMYPFTEDNQIDVFIDGLSRLLDAKEILSNYLLWENLLTYFVVTKKLNTVIEFTNKIVDALKEVDENSNKEKEYLFLRQSNKIINVKDTLIYHFWSCVGRSLSIVWGKEVSDLVKKIVNIINVISDSSQYSVTGLNHLRKNFILSRMNNKSFIPVTMKHILSVFNFEDEGDNRYISELEYLTSNNEKNYEEYKYYPYIVSPFEIGFTYLINRISRGENTLDDPYSYINYIKKEYSKNFTKSKNDYLKKIKFVEEDKKRYIAIGDKKDEAIKIAVANVRMDKKDIEDILDGKNINKSYRAKEISSLVNTAINNYAKVLVMPEAYVPLQYVNLLQKKSASRQLLINCGIEHVVSKGNVWNLTCILVPIEIGNVRYSIPFFRQKKYFAPDEEEDIKKRNYNIPSGFNAPLLFWDGFKFATYCCFELTAINDRADHKGSAEVIFGIEWNRDIQYYSNIMESLSRDLYCYCIQANMSEYGDSRIIAPAHNYKKNILQVKGGENAVILMGTINLKQLREAKINPEKRKDYNFAKLPADF